MCCPGLCAHRFSFKAIISGRLYCRGQLTPRVNTDITVCISPTAPRLPFRPPAANSRNTQVLLSLSGKSDNYRLFAVAAVHSLV